MGVLPAAVATKENRKGSSHSYYNYDRRRIIITLFLFTILSAASIYLFRKRSTSYEGDRPKKVGALTGKPIHKIEYGVQSTPFVMIRSSLDDQLLKRFLQEHLYSCSEEELNNMQELDNRVKAPVYVYEGYYHSLQTSKNVFSKNPNPLIGKDFYKPAAGPFTRAFFDAFRVVNKGVFDGLRENLLGVSSEDDVSYLVAKWIERELHFGDLSIQIHYGRGNEEKLVSGAAWHSDAANSLLHLAVTLRGNRVLHSKRVQRTANNSIRGQLPMEVLEKQQPGDIYLSSSTLMQHAPEFFETDYESRSIAIHARFLYTSSEANHFYMVRTNDSWEKMTSVLANTLSTADIQIPSLSQVESQLLHMQASFLPKK